MSIEFVGGTKKSGRVASCRKASRLLPLLAVMSVLPASSFLAGCAGNVGASSASSNPQQLSLHFSPPNLNFGSVNTGNKTSQIASVKNMGTGPATIALIKSSSNQFTISGLNFPLTLGAGESANFVAWFNGSTAGKTAGTLTFQGTDGGASMVQLAVAGTVAPLQPKLTVSPSVVDAGSAQIGSKTTSNVTLSNTGNADLIVSTMTVNGAAFTLNGITTPKVISSGQSATISVVYAPTAAGTDSGIISITSNDPSSPAAIALNASGTSAPVGHLTLSPSTLSFGGVAVGSSSVLSATVTNTGVAAVHISSAFASGAAFSESGLVAPATLAAGQSAQIHVTYTPTTTGLVGGTVGISSDAPGAAPGLSLSGTGVQAGISVSPASISFGSLINGQSKSQPVVITNTGTGNLHISQLSATGAGVTITGLTAPLTIAPGQSSAFNVQFAPLTSGTTTGTVSVVSNAPSSPASVAVSGAAVAATSNLVVSPGSLSFGNVNAGASASQNVTITNMGNSNATISQVSVSGLGFAASGVATPLTLAPSQSATLNVQFSPKTPVAFSGSVAIVSTSGTATVAATGTGVQASLAVSPASVSFTNVVVGSTNTQLILISNKGNGSLTINQANVTGGKGFSATGLNLPLTLAAGQSSSFSVQFTPLSAGNSSGTISLISTAATAPATVVLTGSTMAATATLSVNPTNISFGSVNLGSAPTQALTLTNTGNSSVTISQINVSGAGFMLSGAGVPVTLLPSQSVPVSVQFDPSVAGAVNGSVSVVSNATGSPAAVTLSGTGAAATAHSVQLNWTGSSSTVAGYNVYRTQTSGSGYTLINGGLVSLDDYSDTTVQSGQTYYYVTTAVDGSGNESAYSNEAQAIVP
jgi:hypothetical protein